VHALIATDVLDRRRAMSDQDRELLLLRALLFTQDGGRLVSSYTVKKSTT